MKAYRLLVLAIVCVASGPAAAQADDGPAVTESVISARFPDRSISALVTQLAEHAPFKRAVLLMPGSPGIMKIESATSFGMKGNFLIRSRRYWLDPETVVLSVDAPSDQWSSFATVFRAGARYAEDIRGLRDEIVRRFGNIPLAVVGTSEGSVSAFYVARALGPANVKVIFSSSLFLSTPHAAGLASLDFDEIKAPMLWVHHVDDPCQWTPYSQARRLAERTHAPLISVRSSNRGTGNPCEARSPHGYIGVERQTVLAMKEWVVDGVAHDVTGP